MADVDPPCASAPALRGGGPDEDDPQKKPTTTHSHVEEQTPFVSLIAHDRALSKFFSLRREKLLSQAPGYGGGTSAAAFNQVIASCINAAGVDSVFRPLSSALGYSQPLVFLRVGRLRNDNASASPAGRELRRCLKEDVEADGKEFWKN